MPWHQNKRRCGSQALRKVAPLVLAATLLAGCSSAPHGPGSTNLVDGSYQGLGYLETSNPKICPESAYGQMEIGDRTLRYAYTPAIIFEAAVQPDGTVHDDEGTATLDGKLTNQRLTFTISTPDCKSTYNNSFIWNHS